MQPEALTTAVSVEVVDHAASTAGCILSTLGTALLYIVILSETN
jgi:hypothetical protein